MTGPYEIGDSTPKPIPPSGLKPQQAPAPTLKKELRPSTGQDSVQLSSQTLELEAIQQAIANLPEIREERLAQIRHDLTAGTYRVESEHLAERIIQETIRNARDLP